MTATDRPGSRAERTRAAVLEAAEALFAERGFATTRLEDVAERVGIRRASIVYYFRDKRALYEAVLDSAFSGLLERVQTALASSDPLPARIEACVGAWVDYVGRRPTFARLLLREVADAGADERPILRRFTRPFVELVEREVVARATRSDAALARVDPVHVASAVAGATLFFVAAMPLLVPERGERLLGPEHLAAHREEVLRIARRLLGLSAAGHAAD